MFLKALSLSEIGCHEMNKNIFFKAKFNKSQSGAVLLVSLIFLLLLTILGLSAIQSSTLQERMAGNGRDVNTAFQAAEAAMREAEEFLQKASLPSFDGNDGLYKVCSDTDSTAAECSSPDWTAFNSSGWVTLSGVTDVSRQPEFYVQEYISVYDPQGELTSDVPPKVVDIYKVISRGFGLSDKSMVALETTYRRD
jgi:type IV pilus assembly protein PilX